MSTPSRWDWRFLKWRAQLALVFGRHAIARDAFTEMLRLFPGDAYALASRAHDHGQTGQRALAIDDLRALVGLHPDRAAADWYNLAFQLEAAGQADEAEPAFRRALEMDPKLDLAWYGLGLVLIQLGRLDEAVMPLKRNTELQPMSPYAWYQLARVHWDRQQPSETRKIIRHLKGFEPKVAAQLEREIGAAA
ncbi:MAG: tetratricopeptide repeat protein [Aquabacterium sp.]